MSIKLFLTAVCFGLLFCTGTAKAQRQYEFINMRPASTEAKIAYETGWRNRYKFQESKNKDELAIRQLSETAIAGLSKTIEIEPKFAPAYYQRGLAYYERASFRASQSPKDSGIANDTTSAINDLSQAIQLAPNYGYAFRLRAIVYRFANRLEDALDDWDKHIEIQKREEPHGLVIKGFINRIGILTKMREFDRALAEADKSIKYFTKPEITDALIQSYTFRIFIYQAKGDIAKRDASVLVRDEFVKIRHQQRQKQIPIITPQTDKKDGSAAPLQTKPTPTPLPSYMMQPDYKAYISAVREKDPDKKVRAIETYLLDFPNSAYIESVQIPLLDAIIKTTPNDGERIYRQALRTIGGVKTNLPFSGIYFIANTYNAVVNLLYKAGMSDKAEEIAQKGIDVIDEVNTRQIFTAKSPMWTTLGQIYLKNGNLLKAEKYFKQSLTGSYEGNTALLGLSDIAEKRKKHKMQLDYLMHADAKGILKKERRAKMEELYLKQYRSTDKLRATLDENYKRLNPFPFSVAKYTTTEKRTKRTILTELFTGSACPPCITADTAFEGLIQRYNPSDVTVLIYDLHIPGPDPLTNPTSLARARFYGAHSTPTYFINGSDKQTGGGIDRKAAKDFIGKLTPKIDSQLERESEAELNLSAARENGIIKATVNFENVRSESSNLKLYVGLVENEVSYMGENGIRFHPMTVREFGGEDHSGFAIKDKSGKIEWNFDLQKISADLKNYLEKYEQERREDDKDFSFIEKKHELNHQNLSVVAFIQDDKTKNILQTAYINLASTKK